MTMFFYVQDVSKLSVLLTNDTVVDSIISQAIDQRKQKRKMEEVHSAFSVFGDYVSVYRITECDLSIARSKYCQHFLSWVFAYLLL